MLLRLFLLRLVSVTTTLGVLVIARQKRKGHLALAKLFQVVTLASSATSTPLVGVRRWRVRGVPVRVPVLVPVPVPPREWGTRTVRMVVVTMVVVVVVVTLGLMRLIVLV